MSIFFGLHARTESPSFQRLSQQLRAAAAPLADATFTQHDGVLIGCADLRIWDEASVEQAGTRLVAVAGQPVYSRHTPESRALSRTALLLRSFAGAAEDFRHHEGSCSALCFDSADRTLRLVTDKSGVRPIYWSMCGDVLVFSNALWVLQGMGDVAARPDLRGAAEVLAYGYPLADRTVLENVEVLSPGCMLTASNQGVHKSAYWDWLQEIPATPVPLSAAELEALFSMAVAERLGQRRHATAFLSGGMDSRWIAQNLRKQQVAVDTVNFAPEGSKDRYFGKLAAEALGTTHFEYQGQAPGFAGKLKDSIDQLHRLQQSSRPQGPRPSRVLWSGDGGSVGVGHVYLTPEIVRTARQAGLPAAVDMIMEFNKLRISKNIFSKQAAPLADCPRQGMLEELQRLTRLEPGRACHLFFMLNDQRRHLAGHYETIHASRIDFVLPFFDARLIGRILAAPVDDFLLHRIYHEVFMGFEGPVRNVPWQTYPGHVACPVEIKDQLRDQWKDGWTATSENGARRKKLQRDGLSLVRSKLFAPSPLSKKHVVIALGMSLAGVRRFDYLIDAAIRFEQLTQGGRRDGAVASS